MTRIQFSFKVPLLWNSDGNQLLELSYLPADRMPLDNLTKALGRIKTSLFCIKQADDEVFKLFLKLQCLSKQHILGHLFEFCLKRNNRSPNIRNGINLSVTVLNYP